jgi:hypothetical protein
MSSNGVMYFEGKGAGGAGEEEISRTGMAK